MFLIGGILKKKQHKKKASKEFVVGQELCFAAPCIVAWAGGSGAAVFLGTTGANQGVLCQGPLKDQACSGLYLSAGRSHRGEINPSDGINCAVGHAGGWAQHSGGGSTGLSFGTEKPPGWAQVCPAAFCCLLAPSPMSWVGCRQLPAPES